MREAVRRDDVLPPVAVKYQLIGLRHDVLCEIVDEERQTEEQQVLPCRPGEQFLPLPEQKHKNHHGDDPHDHEVRDDAGNDLVL